MVCFVAVTTAQRATAQTGKAKEGRTHRFSTITRADQHSYETNFATELVFEKIPLSDSVVKRDFVDFVEVAGHLQELTAQSLVHSSLSRYSLI